ncbi:MAG TPA: aldo/keto reductase [Thermodesulfobacteriota bacterium]|nr:aldo/keto reductase [Thermodesulfobacteriota bacterium]
MEKKLIDRRDFMKSTLAGVGGFLALPSIDTKQEIKIVESKGKARKLIYRTLGKTGLKLPVINMGVMLTDNPNIIRTALDSGVLLLDTGHAYMGGRNEEVVGEVIKGRPRDSFYVGTKVNLPQNRTTGLYIEGATTEEFLKKLDLSLKRLGVDYVDILYQHGVTRKESVAFEPVLKAFDQAKKDGKIRFTGISTHGNEPEVIHAATDSKAYDVILTAYNFKQKHAAEVKNAIARASQAGIGIIGMKAVRGAYQQPPTVRNITASFKWILQDPNVHTVITGFTTFEQMELDLSIMGDLTLTEPEKMELQKEASVRGLYCQGCRQCLGQCLENLPIPDLMRAYMYTYDYRNLALAQDLVVSLNLPSQVCGDCGQCPVKCSVGFNVSGKIRDVVRLRDVPTEFIA